MAVTLRNGLAIDVLGRFGVRRGGEPLPLKEFGGRQAQRLVRLLATRRGSVVTRDLLIDVLWGEAPPTDPEANLNVLVNRARRALGAAESIETVPGGYLMPVSAEAQVDAELFEAHVRRARTASGAGDHRAAVAAVQDALRLWRGDPLPEDTFESWAEQVRERLVALHQEALELGSESGLASGEVRLAAEWAAAASAQEPLREAAALLHARALDALGDTAAALAAYTDYRGRLADELGIDPSPVAAATYQRLLGAPTTPAPHEAGQAARFVGRDNELRTIRGSRIAVVRGPGGSGKSRLLQETLAVEGRPVLTARAVQPEQDVPWSLARKLLRSAVDAGADPARLPGRLRTALAEVLPELDLLAPTGPALDARSRRALALDAARRLVASAPGTIALDDLQWGDASSLELVRVLVGDDDARRWVVCSRPLEANSPQANRGFLAWLGSLPDAREVGIGPLTSDDVARLVDDPTVARTLVESTDASPFEVLDVLRSLEHNDGVRRDRDRWVVTAHDTVVRAERAAANGRRRSIAARVDQLTDERRELLHLLAVLDRSADTGLLMRASGRDDAEVVLRSMDGSMLVTLDHHGWRLAHDLVAETLRETLSPVERARLHQRLARALEGSGDTAERARHLAGAGDVPAAVTAYLRAARIDLDRFADREALALSDSGLSLDPTGPGRSELLELRGEARARLGERAAARDDLRASLAGTSRAEARVRILCRLAQLASGADDMVRAEQLVTLALAEPTDSASARARALSTAAIIDMNLDRPAKADERYDQALELYRSAGDPHGIADIMDARAMRTFLGGAITTAIEAFDQVAELYADIGNLLRVVTPRSTAGHALVLAGRPADGVQHIHAALDLARSLGDHEGTAYVLFHHAEALAALGRLDEAAAAAEEAISVARAIGHRGWTATGLRERGYVRFAEGDLDAARVAFTHCLEHTAHLPPFRSWAFAGLARVEVAAGRLEEAADHVSAALGTGPQLTHYEARLAEAELAVAAGHDDAGVVLDRAIRLAAEGGYGSHLPRLEELDSIRNR